jgi:ATP/maltotriose-dependent transcriptional regulator MalT
VSGHGGGMDELDLLLDLWEWERRLEYTAIRGALEALPRGDVLASDELSLQLLYACIYLRDTVAAAALAAQMEPRFAHGRNEAAARRFLNAQGQIALVRGELTASQRLVEELRDKAELAGDPPQQFYATVHLGIIAGLRGDFTASLQECYRALAMCGTVDTDVWLPVLHHNLALSFREIGMIAEAERHFELSTRDPRPDWVTATTALDRALLRYVVGDFETAAGMARNGLALFQRIGSANGVADAHVVLARIALGQRDEDEAAAQLALAEERLDPSETMVMAQLQEERAVLHLLRGDEAGRARAAAAADEAYRRLEAPWRAERMRMRLESLASARGAPGDGDARAESWANTPDL